MSAPPFSLEAVVEAVREAVPDAVAAYLFGSHAAGAARSESDVDLAVLLPGGRTLSSEALWDARESISKALGAEKVDLVDLRAASTVMRVQVVSTGRVLFEADRTARERFEMHTYSAYALLNEERSAILDGIRRRGRVYGG